VKVALNFTRHYICFFLGEIYISHLLYLSTYYADVSGRAVSVSGDRRGRIARLLLQRRKSMADGHVAGAKAKALG
ncbi:hypothetical protein, partial [Roseicella aquatilis]|uniref:hypothetical protein n=1 Tax=Roseicella aquatilis TaxID=2527868 RepID=UPI00197F82CF